MENLSTLIKELPVSEFEGSNSNKVLPYCDSCHSNEDAPKASLRKAEAEIVVLKGKEKVFDLISQVFREDQVKWFKNKVEIILISGLDLEFRVNVEI